MAAGAVDHRPSRVFVAQLGAEGGRLVASFVQLGRQRGCAIQRLVGMNGDAVAVSASVRTIIAPTRAAPPVTSTTGSRS